MNLESEGLLSPNPSPPEEARGVSAATLGRFMGCMREVRLGKFSPLTPAPAAFAPKLRRAKEEERGTSTPAFGYIFI